VNRVFALLIVSSLAFAGCSNQNAAGKSEGEKGAPPSEAAKVEGTAVELTPKNTSIEFVGTHSGDKPDPRKGGFKEFKGTATVADKKLTAIKVDIDTTSIYTEIDKLTNHLKNADFFDVNEHPKATFESTKIEPAAEGKVNITGNLTLLKATEPVTFLADVDASDELKLAADFTIDRTKFGMTYGKGQVENDVTLTIRVGK
jgi:polyisoprenoid-binding protein YceI